MSMLSSCLFTFQCPFRSLVSQIKHPEKSPFLSPSASSLQGPEGPSGPRTAGQETSPDVHDWIVKLNNDSWLHNIDIITTLKMQSSPPKAYYFSVFSIPRRRVQDCLGLSRRTNNFFMLPAPSLGLGGTNARPQ